ncbi:MAG: hypothetical protein ACE5G5_12995 [Candidatus Methylomirabilales bacterium]
MSWKTEGSFFQTAAFRITLWYAALFGALSLAVFLVVYFSLTSSLGRRTDEELLSTAKEFEALYRVGGAAALQAEFNREAESRGIRREFFSIAFSAGTRSGFVQSQRMAGAREASSPRIGGERSRYGF